MNNENETLLDKAEMFSSWEAKTRYIKNYKLEKRKVVTAITEVEKYIDNLIKQKDIITINEPIDVLDKKYSQVQQKSNQINKEQDVKN